MKIDIDENKVIQNERRQFYLDQLIKTEIKFQQISSCRQVYQEIDLKKMVKKYFIVNKYHDFVYFIIQ